MSSARSTPRARAAGSPVRPEPVPAPRRGRERLFHPFAGEVPVLLVPGLNDSGPRHWQSLWERVHPTFHRVVQPDFATPDLERWASVVTTYVRAAPMPPLVVAHSFGCLAVIRAACMTRLPLAGVMLVAPADPEQFDFGPQLRAARLPCPVVLVASTNDPWLRFTHAGRLAQQWGARLVACGNVGHINADSGLGAWPAGIALLRDLAERAAAAGTIVSPRGRASPSSLATGNGRPATW